jgi:hypothetical protein
MSAADPLELIADWWLADYPQDNLANQLGITAERLESWLRRLFPVQPSQHWPSVSGKTDFNVNC